MKEKIIFLSLALAFALSASMVFAQGTGNKNDDAGNPGLTQEEKENDQGSQQGSDTQEKQQESSQGDGVNKSTQTQNQEQVQEQTQQNEESNDEIIREQTHQQVRAVNMTQLKEMIKDKKRAMNQEIEAMKDEKQQEIHQNQNEVRMAVHALLASENLVGGIGSEVSKIARTFNNSVQKTIQAEEKIQKRNKIVKFFFGGDEEAAEDILQEVNKNKEKIKNLKELKQQCDCDEEVKDIVQEQIQNMEQEQNRLGQLAQEQKSKRGLFGWLFGWMKK
jgi:hypothetical protein